MKKLLIYIGIATVLLQVGCTKDFTKINTDPKQTAVIDPNYLLTSAQYVYSSQGYNIFLFESMWAQTLASTSSLTSNYLSNADKYVASSGTTDYQGRIWNTDFGATDQFFTGAASLVYEAMNISKADASKDNITAICSIMKVLILEQATDVYGDIPYSQALQGKAGITQPAYDKQQDIYNSMLSELDAAIAMFDASKVLATGDMYYKGDITKWKKFTYSLMLRIAMRLTKVDAATAKQWVEKADAGGTFASIADNAFIATQNSNGHDNALARVYGVDIYQTRWSKTLIDYLRKNNDPRLTVVAEVPPDGLAANKSTAAGVTDSSVQIGLPNGFDLNGGSFDISTSAGYPGPTGTGADITPIGKYSRPTASVYANGNGPIFVLTYAETELLLAEAAARGWNVSGSAATHYANGVSAALQSLATLGSALTISAATATAYAASHPLDVSSLNNSLKQINEQYWATTGTMFNYIETWINWKRSDYPVLTPVVFPGNFSHDVIPRRQQYPPSEKTLNGTNYTAAVSTLTGGDEWNSRVWWDVP
ncbi:Starch-binding associating with outer membrane [Chitinophaga sp. CF118]|uniref:SusD/RagB family nutrient-binding outer membrane lipoprotein n=1 Tax=Chitinophaga sp. CF118 TaxID=1884367 RepID=UPI0008DF1677|nr:SusD/RagB family nutrient-binding outer membrane lipoprotein [Chitinophaga sp. CF118]SFD08000.1 Starch-binding associating with outer membrane [Chitinophaga sp. CF118]